jgi:hypothetical protein
MLSEVFQPDPFTGVGLFCGPLLLVTEFLLGINGLRYNANFRETAPNKLRAIQSHSEPS